MSRMCQFCGKKTVAGRSISRRGMAKKKGGVGKKVTGITIRKFKPNVHNLKVEIDGTIRTVKICAKCLKAGFVNKPVKKQAPKA